MRCEAVLRGGAEAEPAKAPSQLSCVEAGGGQASGGCRLALGGWQGTERLLHRAPLRSQP